MNDYVILFDENGQPYIAHGQIITNLQKGAKSVAKWVDGKKSRYFKTQEELKAFYDQGKKKAGQAIDKAKAGAKKAAGNVRGTASKVYSGARSAYDKGKKAVANAADKLGVDERKAWKDAEKQVRKDLSSGSKSLKKNIDRMTKNYEKYLETPLGKVHDFFEDAEVKFTDAKDTISNYAYVKVHQVRDSIHRTALSVDNAIKQKAYEVAIREYGEARGTDKELEAHGDMIKAERAANGIPYKGIYDYNYSALGTIAKGAASSAGRTIKGAVSSGAKKVKDAASGVYTSVEINVADRKRQKAWEKYNKAKESGADKKTLKKLKKEFEQAQTDWMLKSGL